MKIVIDARMYGFENGGIGRYVVNLVSELENIDHENNYTLLLRKKHFNQLNLKNDNWEKIAVDARHYSVKEQILVTKVLNQINPDIVHFPHFNVPVFYKGNFVVTIHDLLMHKRTGKAATTLPYWLYLIKRGGYKSVFNNAVKRSQKIIVPSKFVKTQISKEYQGIAEKVSVVYEGVDDNVFRRSAVSGILRKRKIEKPYFLYVGNVYPHKNIERTIEAIAMINETSEHKISLAIVTPRNVFQKRLDEYVEKHNAKAFVHFTGYVEDDELSYLYKQAAAFVYPSKEEGFGLPGLETMANKTLLLASDIPVFREVYKDNALYFNPLDFSSIAKAMQDVLSLPRDKKVEITNKAFEFAKIYTWEKAARETLRVYESALSKVPEVST
jgi:glycosyltransferase involved in cell wall biosynthesis